MDLEYVMMQDLPWRLLAHLVTDVLTTSLHCSQSQMCVVHIIADLVVSKNEARVMKFTYLISWHLRPSLESTE